MTQQIENRFVKGMRKDISDELLSNESYRDATNYRLITTEGSTTGSLENIQGNRSLIPLLDNTTTIAAGKNYLVVSTNPVVYNGTTYNKGQIFLGAAPAPSFSGSGKVVCYTDWIYPIDVAGTYRINGAVEIRDSIVLFLTRNTTSDPVSEGLTSMIVLITIDIENEKYSTFTVIYDDAGVRVATDLLNLSTYYPIKAISRYESPTVQKIYWVDGFNKVRYANIAENLTEFGGTYVFGVDHYMSPNKFEFQPTFEFVRPELEEITAGSLKPGIVQYAYQLYRLNGAETTISPLSDMIHITPSNDYMTTSKNYFGIGDTSVSAGKGCKIEIDNTGNIGYNRLRLYRVHYTEYNQTPSIYIVNEISTDPTGETVHITDTGSHLTQITIDEFNIASTELFVAQDIDSKDNRLFAANIETTIFDIGDFDSRAVRFRQVHDTDTDSSAEIDIAYREVGGGTVGVTCEKGALDNLMRVTIVGISGWVAMGLDPSWTLVSIDSITTDGGGTGNAVDSGVWHDNLHNNNNFSSTTANTNINVISYTASTDTLIFECESTAGDYFGIGYDHINTVDLPDFVFNYTYDYVSVENAIVFDIADLVNPDITFTVPASDDYPGWAAAGWDVTDLENDFPLTHDAINIFNDPDNDYGGTGYESKYQSDCTTLGAEGPNIKIGFDLDDIKLDYGDADCLYYESQQDLTTGSYNGLASPFLSGKRSWQRDEVYRLFMVYYNDRGQSSYPSWICDLKMPSLKDTGYELTTYAVDVVTGKMLYPTVELKNMPTGAVSAQVYAVPRTSTDRSIITQTVALSTITDGADITPDRTDDPVQAEEIVRLFSPEISINRSITTKGSDYLDYVGTYSDVDDSGAWDTNVKVYKLRDFDPVTKGSNNETDLLASKIITPSDDVQTVGSFTYINYNDTEDCFGGTTLIAEYDNVNWDARGDTYCVVNYRQDVFASQYGGLTYEARTRNYCRPCSGLITAVSTPINCYNGDTFINYFQCLPLISDLTKDCILNNQSLMEVLYVPLESTINLDLRHDYCFKNQYQIQIIGGGSCLSALMQEVGGEWTDAGSQVYNQPTDLYLYNPVYSQESLIDYKYAKPFDYIEQTVFDCRVKASRVKINGENTDQWTKFGVNEYIDVDSKLNAVYAIKNVNDNMLFWQDRGFGSLSINDRYLITDNNSAQLVLGTGGVLDRYTYISDRVGCRDKFSIVRGKAGVYWYDRITNTLQHFAENVVNFSREKDIQSYLDSIVTSSHKAISAYDIENDEILFTFYHPTATNGYTLSYNELMGCFVSRYTFIPTLYIPFKNRLVTTTSRYYNNEPVYAGSIYFINNDRLFINNSRLNNRCYFYSLSDNEHNCYHDSTIKLTFNPEYPYTKTFDNINYISNLYNNSNVEVYDKTFDHLRCYNDYQNSDYINLSPGINIKRRERSWTIDVPRNIVNIDIGLYPDIFDTNNFDATRRFRERLRDKYMVVDLVLKNDGNNNKFVFNKIGCTYRRSIR